MPIPAPTRQDRPELLDSPGSVLPALAGNLRDIRRLNRWFGGVAYSWSQIQPYVAGRERVSLLDVATGSGDIPIDLARRARDRGTSIDVVGLDISDDVLKVARASTGDANIRLVRGDARHLPWPDGSFDVVLCCLAVHHFAPDDAVRVLAEMWRVARRAAVVTDLRRSYAAYAATWLVTRTLARNPLTRHDGPLSVLRAYTPAEMRLLGERAGWQHVRATTHPLFRQALTGCKDNVVA